MSSTGYSVFKLGYEISPILLVGGIASVIPGGMLPIVALTEAESFTLGILQGSNVPSLDQFFAHWKPVGGTTLIDNQVGQYPFANQAVAANAIIAQPLQVSMLMYCPVQSEGGYTSKLATLTVVQQTLAQHNATGGLYTVATPSNIYANCILVKVTDVSGGESHQPQYAWQFDFIQPLITANQTVQVLNNLMGKIGGGLPTPQIPTWSGPSSAIGPAPGPTWNLVPSASNSIGSLVQVPYNPFQYQIGQ